MAPRISVVIPTFNVARYVGECLASVRAQSMPDWECIVVDDGSTDGTAERVLEQADPRVRLIRQRHGGVSSARNAGLADALAGYVLFLDGDDLLHPQALSRLAAHLDAHPEAVAAYGTVWTVFENGRSYPQKALHRRRFRSGELLAPLMRGDIFLLMGSTLVRTRDAREIEGFETSLRLSEDWEFWCRLAGRGPFRFIGAQPEVCYVRVRNRSSSRLLSASWENHLPTLQAVIANAALAARFGVAEWRGLTRQALAFHLWEAGRVNFTARRYAEGRRLMLRSLAEQPTLKRLALFALAHASQLLGTSLVPRLRFADEDANR
jgi:glycosyltransferase involved in cell wall biosynthesis